LCQLREIYALVTDLANLGHDFKRVSSHTGSCIAGWKHRAFKQLIQINP